MSKRHYARLDFSKQFKGYKKWLTKFQTTALLAVHVWASALQALFQKVTSTRSTLMYALTAVLAQMLALWGQFPLQSKSACIAMHKKRRPRFFGAASSLYVLSYFVSGDIITSMKLPWSRTALRADLMLSALISFTAASYSLS